MCELQLFCHIDAQIDTLGVIESRYASAQHMVDRYGRVEIIQLTDRAPRPTVIDLAVLQRALTDAEAEIDARLPTRFALPLSQVPRLLTNVACDIARYRLYDDRATEQVTKRYDAAVRLLDQVRKGEISLGLDTQDQPVAPTGGARVAGGKRAFGPGTLDDFLGS